MRRIFLFLIPIFLFNACDKTNLETERENKDKTAFNADLESIMEADVDAKKLVVNSEKNLEDSEYLIEMPIPPHPNTTFDERKFVELLAGSISLTINEKRKIIEAIPQLSQFQIDELIKIFEEEKVKFDELEQQYKPWL